jgi:hypothetical protein
MHQKTITMHSMGKEELLCGDRECDVMVLLELGVYGLTQLFPVDFFAIFQFYEASQRLKKER